MSISLWGGGVSQLLWDEKRDEHYTGIKLF